VSADTSYTGCITPEEKTSAGKSQCVLNGLHIAYIQRGKGNVTKHCLTSTIPVHKYVMYSPFKINKSLFEYILVP
jgi:hypothetical protein